MAEKEVTLKLTLTKALALEKIATTGLRVTEALILVQNTATMERALDRLREQLGPAKKTV